MQSEGRLLKENKQKLVKAFEEQQERPSSWSEKVLAKHYSRSFCYQCFWQGQGQITRGIICLAKFGLRRTNALVDIWIALGATRGESSRAYGHRNWKPPKATTVRNSSDTTKSFLSNHGYRTPSAMASPVEQALSLLSTIKHPVEGMAYLFYLALIVRWRWPKAWNKFLDRCKAREEFKSL